MGLFLYNGISLKNEDSAQKIGTDSILLGNWLSPLPTDCRMLDIGTGTGILALLCAQKRSEVEAIRQDSGDLSRDESGHRRNLPVDCSGGVADWSITALEIDAPSCAEAQTNFEASAWAPHLQVLSISLQDFVKVCTEGASFDYIFTNPPYFVGSLKAPDARRTEARHTTTLTHEEIISAAFCLLRTGGRLALILPTAEAKNFIQMAELYHIGRDLPQRGSLRLTRRSDDHPKRVLMEFTLLAPRV